MLKMRPQCSLLTVIWNVILILQPQDSHAAPQEDLITELPGLSEQPPYKQYSGYLKGDDVGDKFLHYWFVESSNNPRTDPLVLWTNGGPGCSGIFGLLAELGPYKFKPDGSLEYNPYTWNQVANMIYIETPVGVGYSYSASGNIKSDDVITAKQNAMALQDFFKKFPEYKDQDFYISGESYAGVYIPSLASLVMDIPAIHLKGFIIGNAVSNWDDNANSLMYFTYNHGLIGDEEWNYLQDNCCPESEAHRCDFSKAARHDKNCYDRVKKIHYVAWRSPGLDVYNIYGKCDVVPRRMTSSSLLWMPETDQSSSYSGWEFSSLNLFNNNTNKLVGVTTCTDYTSLNNYMNLPAVRRALHVKPGLRQWFSCNSQVGSLYTNIYKDTSEFYKKALRHKLRLLLYNGDVDMACNFLGDEWFVDRLPLQNPGKRKFWYYTDEDKTTQIGGLVKTFDQMTLVTVRGSGHKVPFDKPIPALELFVNYIQQKPFKT